MQFRQKQKLSYKTIAANKLFGPYRKYLKKYIGIYNWMNPMLVPIVLIET